MKGLARAATAWIWADTAIKLIGVVAVAGVSVAVMLVLAGIPKVLGF